MFTLVPDSFQATNGTILPLSHLQEEPHLPQEPAASCTDNLQPVSSREQVPSGHSLSPGPGQWSLENRDQSPVAQSDVPQAGQQMPSFVLSLLLPTLHHGALKRQSHLSDLTPMWSAAQCAGTAAIPTQTNAWETRVTVFILERVAGIQFHRSSWLQVLTRGNTGTNMGKRATERQMNGRSKKEDPKAPDTQSRRPLFLSWQRNAVLYWTDEERRRIMNCPPQLQLN